MSRLNFKLRNPATIYRSVAVATLSSVIVAISEGLRFLGQPFGGEKLVVVSPFVAHTNTAIIDRAGCR